MRSRESADQEIEPSVVGSWARRFLAVVLIGFSVGAFVNVGTESRYRPEARALLVRMSGDLSTVTGTEPSPRGRYWVASIVHDIAWGGVVVVPDGSLISSSRFRNLAGVGVRIEDYDPTLTPGMVDSLGGLPVIRGVGNITGNDDYVPFAVVWSEEGTPVPVLRLWFFEGAMFLIDDRVEMAGVNQ